MLAYIPGDYCSLHKSWRACEINQNVHLPCSPHISTTKHLFPIILVDLECNHRYLSHNIVYMLKKPQNKKNSAEVVIWDCTPSGAISLLKFIKVKPYLNIKCHSTVCRAKNFAESGSVLPENEGTCLWVSSHHVPGAKRIDFSNFFYPMHCTMSFYIEILLYFYKFWPGNGSRGCTVSDEDLWRQILILRFFKHINYIVR